MGTPFQRTRRGPRVNRVPLCEEEGTPVFRHLGRSSSPKGVVGGVPFRVELCQVKVEHVFREYTLPQEDHTEAPVFPFVHQRGIVTPRRESVRSLDTPHLCSFEDRVPTCDLPGRGSKGSGNSLFLTLTGRLDSESLNTIGTWGERKVWSSSVPFSFFCLGGFDGSLRLGSLGLGGHVDGRTGRVKDETDIFRTSSQLAQRFFY